MQQLMFYVPYHLFYSNAILFSNCFKSYAVSASGFSADRSADADDDYTVITLDLPEAADFLRGQNIRVKG